MPAATAARTLPGLSCLLYHLHPSGGRPAGTVDGLQDLGAARADEPGQSHDLAGPQLQVHRGEFALPGQPLDRQDGLRRGRSRTVRGAGREDVLDLAAGHHGNDVVCRCGLGGQPDGHRPAVLEHRHPVSDPADLLQAVRDVDDGDPVGGEGGDDAEEVVDLVRVERGGRLVHDDEPYVVRERPRHGDDLLLGGGQRADRAGRVDLRVAEPLQQCPGGRAALAGADDEAGGGGFMAEEDVLGDRQSLDQVQFLVDGGDAQTHGGDRRLQRDRCAAPGDLAAVGLVGPGEHLDEGGLAGAVLPEETVDFMRPGPPGPRRRGRVLRGTTW